MITTFFLLQLFVDLDRYPGYVGRKYIPLFCLALILSFRCSLLTKRESYERCTVKYFSSGNNRNGSRVKKIQLVAQLILSIFRQPLHVSGVSRPIIGRYNRIGTLFEQQSSKKNKKYQLLYTYGCRGQLKCDGTHPETRFRRLAKWTSQFKSAGVSVRLTTGSWGVHIIFYCR